MWSRLLWVLAVICFPLKSKAEVIAGPITNAQTGHLYYLLAPASWTRSEMEAVTLGGHLVTINDEGECLWLYTTFSFWQGQARALWIGLTDQNEEGTFRWISGESPAFTNWSHGEPDNIAGPETPANYAYFAPVPAGRGPRWYDFNDSANDNWIAAGQWNDASDSVFLAHGVVEVLPGHDTHPKLTIEQRPGSSIKLQWHSRSNAVYQLQGSQDLHDGIWVNLGPKLRGSGNQMAILDEETAGSARFFRLSIADSNSD